MTPEEILELTKHFLTLIAKEWSIATVSQSGWETYGAEIAEQVSRFHLKLTKSNK